MHSRVKRVCMCEYVMYDSTVEPKLYLLLKNTECDSKYIRTYFPTVNLEQGPCGSVRHFGSLADCHVCHDIVKGKPLSPGHVVIPLCRQPC